MLLTDSYGSIRCNRNRLSGLDGIKEIFAELVNDDDAFIEPDIRKNDAGSSQRVNMV